MCTHCVQFNGRHGAKASSKYNNNNINTYNIIDLTFSSGGGMPAFAADDLHRRLW